MNRIVGMDRMPYRAARDGLSSTLTLARLTLPADSRLSSSRVGAMARHGAHHSAQKSTIRTSGWLLISVSNVASVRWSAVSAMAGVDLLGTAGSAAVR